MCIYVYVYISIYLYSAPAAPFLPLPVSRPASARVRFWSSRASAAVNRRKGAMRVN